MVPRGILQVCHIILKARRDYKSLAIPFVWLLLWESVWIFGVLRDLKMPRLPEDALDRLKEHAYKSVGETWLDRMHQPFWNCEYDFEVFMAM